MVLIKFNKTVQVGPDDYEVQSQERMFNEEATIGDIREWIESKERSGVSNPFSNSSFEGKVVIITEPEQDE